MCGNLQESNNHATCMLHFEGNFRIRKDGKTCQLLVLLSKKSMPQGMIEYSKSFFYLGKHKAQFD